MNEEKTENIEVEEEATESEEKKWKEEFKVAADELVETVKRLVHETNVRRVVVKNEAKQINLSIPLLAGVAGIALLPVYSALALITALVTDCTIEVVRVEKTKTA